MFVRPPFPVSFSETKDFESFVEVARRRTEASFTILLRMSPDTTYTTLRRLAAEIIPCPLPVRHRIEVTLALLSDKILYIPGIQLCPVSYHLAPPSAPPSLSIILVGVADPPQAPELVPSGSCPHLLVKDCGTMFHTVEWHLFKTAVDPILALVIGADESLTNPSYLLAYEIKGVVTEGW